MKFKITDAQRAAARAIAAVWTAQNDSKEPAFTEDEILRTAFSDGLIALEKEFLGINSLDHSTRPGEPDYPNSTPVVSALVNALRS